ncbi:hypothetical protein BHM03_00018400, partial [Ensete ventricosum]
AMEIVRSQRKPADAAVAPALSLYRSAPALEVRLEDFELYAIDRLRVCGDIVNPLGLMVADSIFLNRFGAVLQGISDGLSRGKKPEEMEKLVTFVSELWRAQMRHQDPSEEMNKDIISHFVLRLVYCRTIVFSTLQTVKDKLNQVARSTGPSSNAETLFFKVPFEEVPELVAGRRVFMLKGFAYVAMNQVHYLPQPKEFSEIALKDIDQLASTSFPLCMRHLFDKVGVGLKLEDALAFWKSEFSQKVLDCPGLFLISSADNNCYILTQVGAERFDKEYSYSIRHNYGKEGKRTVCYPA